MTTNEDTPDEELATCPLCRGLARLWRDRSCVFCDSSGSIPTYMLVEYRLLVSKHSGFVSLYLQAIREDLCREILARYGK